MKTYASGAARAFLLAALPLCAVPTLAQTQAQPLRSSITTFDKNGRAIIQPTSGDPTRSSIVTFGDDGTPRITYTSPPLTPNPDGIQQPQSIAGLIANQNIYGQSAPNPTPGNYTRFNYNYNPVYAPGYGYPAPGYGYPAPGYGYPAPGYGYGYGAPAYPTQQTPYTIQLPNSNLSWSTPTSITSIPLNPGYAYGPNYPVPAYPAPGYGYAYPAPAYGYGAPVYGYPYGGYGGAYSSNSTSYGVRFGRGGFSASIGGNNSTSRSSTTTTITTR